MMFQHYLRLYIRNFSKNRVYTILNILGLAIGISCVLIIITYINFELSFDKHHENYQYIIRITENIKSEDGSIIYSAKTPPRVHYTLQDNGIPGIEKMGRLFPFPAYISSDKKTWNKEDLFIYADSTIFSIFSFELISGSINDVNKPFSVILTKSMAVKYYGKTDIIGEELIYEDEISQFSFNIIAVVKDSPPNSHFDYDFLTSFITLDTVMPWYNSWYYPYLFTYALINATTFESSLTIESQLNKKLVSSLPEKEKELRTYSIQALPDIHLHSHLTSEWKTNSRYEYVIIFLIIALFILLISCVNFINLATSKAIRRSKDVGVQKVMGASRKILFCQFMGESLLMTLLSFILAFVLTEWVLLLLFNSIVDRELTLAFLMEFEYILYVIAGLLTISLLAGTYPAIMLSSFKPVDVFRNKGSGGRGSSRLRKFLVTFQFGISCFLIAGTLIVVKQVNFMKNTNLGFVKDFILLVKLSNRHDQQNYQQFIDQISQYSNVLGVVVSSHVPGSETLYDNPVMPENSLKEKGYNMFTLSVGHEFADVYDLSVLYGRNFSKDNKNDVEQSVMINESAARLFGWELENVVGRKLQLTWYADSALVKKTTIIGIVKDFHFKSLHNKIVPLVIHVNTHVYYTEYISVRFAETNFDDALKFLTTEWKKFSPDRPLESSFLDDKLANLYESETQAGMILTLFAILAIFISCLGLFGLSAYEVEIRLKEIGIRKTMGASVNSIVRLLTKDFIILILIGNVIGLPLVSILSGNWMDNFAYRISAGVGVYVITIVMALIIGLLTISFQSIKASNANPIDALKDE